MSKAIISLPTQAEIVDLFQQTLISGFSRVNTRLSFHSKILLPKNSCGQPKENLILIYKTKNDTKNIFRDKRVVTEILKMDENNQYGNALTKPLPTGGIKKMKEIPSLKEFDLIMQVIFDEDKIEHLFVVDIESDEKMMMKNNYFLTKFTLQVLKKKNVLFGNERSVF